MLRHKYLLLSATAALMLCGAAYAQAATGTVIVNGHVTGSCTIQTASGDGTNTNSSNVTSESGGGSSVTANIDLGELDDTSNGKIKSTLSGSTAGFTTAAGVAFFSLTCNTGTPSVTLAANAMLNGTGAPPTGYTNRVDYTAEADFAQADTTTVAKYTYMTNGAGSAGAGTPISTQLSTATGNMWVQVYNVNTDNNGNSSVLTQGTYGGGGAGGGTITVTITP